MKNIKPLPPLSDKAFWIALCLIHLLYWGYQFQFGPYLLDDSHEYLWEAQNIREKGHFYAGDPKKPIDLRLYTKRPPLYPLILAAVPSVTIILIIQNLAALLALWLLRQTLHLWGYKIRNELLLLLLIFSPAHFIYANLVMSETFLELMLSAMVYIMAVYFHKPKQVLLWIFNALVCLAVLIKPVLYPFIGLNAILMLYLSWRKRMVWPITTSILPILCVLFISFWNAQRTGHAQYSSITTINLVNYNLYYFLMQQEGTQSADSLIHYIHQKGSEIGSYAMGIDYENQAATELLKEQIWPYTLFHLKGCVRFFLDPGRFDMSNYFLPQDKNKNGLLEVLNKGNWNDTVYFLFHQQSPMMLLLLFLVSLMNIVKLYGFARFIWLKAYSWPEKLMFTIPLLYISILTGPLGASRFMVPVLLIYLGGAMLGLSYKKEPGDCIKLN